VSAGSGAWLRRQREACGWSRQELAIRITGAAGSAVTAPVPALESYISRWEAGKVEISARYRQLLNAVLGPDAEVSVPQPSSGPVPDPRKWVRAVHALASDIVGGAFTPGGQLPAHAVLAQRYGLTADAVRRAQDELLSVGVLSRGQVYGTLHVTQATGRQVPGGSLWAAPGLADPGRHAAVIPPGRAGRGGGRTARAARDPRGYARPGTWTPAVRAGSGIEPGKGPACSPAAAGEPSPAGEPSEFLFVKECAAQARVSPRIIYELVRHGHVEAIRLRRDIRIYARSWRAYLHTPPLDLHPSPEPDGDSQRDGLPAVHIPPAGPWPGHVPSSHAGAPPAVFRAPS
jgi:transcriptional regulator with XRE-family HTH domain